MTVRLATPDDAVAVAAIYAPYVRDTAISFEGEPPTVAAMEERIARTLARFPWLVAEDGAAVRGFAYAGEHRTRAAYRWSVDVTVYVAADAHRSGIGRQLYCALLALLTAQGYRQAFAGIAEPNPASTGLHAALGFRHVGTYRDVGFKLGRWYDVGWWQRGLGAEPGEPAEPTPLAALDADVIASALA